MRSAGHVFKRQVSRSCNHVPCTVCAKCGDFLFNVPLFCYIHEMLSGHFSIVPLSKVRCNPEVVVVTHRSPVIAVACSPLVFVQLVYSTTVDLEGKSSVEILR